MVIHHVPPRLVRVLAARNWKPRGFFWPFGPIILFTVTTRGGGSSAFRILLNNCGNAYEFEYQIIRDFVGIAACRSLRRILSRGPLFSARLYV
jgi:hypothetical protein